MLCCVSFRRVSLCVVNLIVRVMCCLLLRALFAFVVVSFRCVVLWFGCVVCVRGCACVGLRCVCGL